MSDLPIYLDHHATTPVDPRVVDAMAPFWTTQFGNAASFQHEYGRQAAQRIEAATQQIAELLQCDPKCVVFTSGATEANNLAIKGILGPKLRQRSIAATPHVISTQVEHRAVIDPLKKLERRGVDVTWLPVDETGLIRLSDLEDAFRPETKLVSIIWASNEVGSIHPLAEIAALCEQRSIILHTDAVQAVGKLPINLSVSEAVNLLSFSAHKLYGPPGIGCLYVQPDDNRSFRLEPQIEGGGHQRGFRSGTLPLPLIIGFGKACEIARQESKEEQLRLMQLRDQFQQLLQQGIPDIRINGDLNNRLAGNLNISIPQVDGEALLSHLTEIAVSSGSACTSTNPEPSHVLRAMGIDDRLCRASLRFGLGRSTTAVELHEAARHVIEVVNSLRQS
ncbi:Cysteine desulfurase [Polystyrenella longa]|uniref:cysteine desulfurase n=1 Tax=Polystyrenella longa TaxID=2528007 RepID=A0A518CQL8_9PLAN|nr:cysteine desulfurase family protein [Polystyrenella longa]QDU81521.1 Cysteine desulfurase [Polystyrenella longa]